MTGCIERDLHQGNRYARIGQRKAHRVAWEERHGPIPDGLELHHVCENPACVNVDHLRLVARSEHQRIHRNTDTCKNGLHAMTEENILWSSRGERLCRACNNARWHRWKEGTTLRSLR